MTKSKTFPNPSIKMNKMLLSFVIAILISLIVSCSHRSPGDTVVQTQTEIIYCTYDPSNVIGTEGSFVDGEAVADIPEKWLAVRKKMGDLSRINNLINESADCLRRLPGTVYNDVVVYRDRGGNHVMVMRKDTPHYLVIHRQVERVGDAYFAYDWPAEKAVNNAELEEYLFSGFGK